MGGHDSLNHRVFSRDDIGFDDEELERQLGRAEEAILAGVREAVAGGSILDLGVGGGRTTEPLLDLSRDYIGVDYAQQCVDLCRTRFPGVDFRPGDARDLSTFEDGSFDLVFFSFNGIDYVGHDARLQILSEVRRVVKDGGYFVFSSHNLHAWQRESLNGRLVKGLRRKGVRPKALSMARFVFSLGNRLRLGRHELVTDEYAIINDCAREFSLLTYYIGVPQQMAQLERAGFSLIRAHGRDGAELPPDRNDSVNQFVYYTALKTT